MSSLFKNAAKKTDKITTKSNSTSNLMDMPEVVPISTLNTLKMKPSVKSEVNTLAAASADPNKEGLRRLLHARKEEQQAPPITTVPKVPIAVPNPTNSMPNEEAPLIPEPIVQTGNSNFTTARKANMKDGNSSQANMVGKPRNIVIKAFPAYDPKNHSVSVVNCNMPCFLEGAAVIDNIFGDNQSFWELDEK
jgi:hypothetical protein